MTQTNTQEVALFTPVEPAELTAVEGGVPSDAPTIWHGPIDVRKIWHGPIVNHDPDNRPIIPLNAAK
jgi:hypothetical protein